MKIVRFALVAATTAGVVAATASPAAAAPPFVALVDVTAEGPGHQSGAR